METVAVLALQNRLPMTGFAPQAQVGALMEYGADLVDLYFRRCVGSRGKSRDDHNSDRVCKWQRPAQVWPCRKFQSTWRQYHRRELLRDRAGGETAGTTARTGTSSHYFRRALKSE